MKENLIYKSEKIINDPIYGGISLNEIELQLVDTPIFQRLRGLNQLGTVNLVFPSSEHNRFTHSLGVLFIMQKMCNHLKNLGHLESDDIKYLRVAALLHDIGHYPLSHLGETVYGFIEDEINSDKSLLKNPPEDLNPIPIWSNSHTKTCHHEKLGASIIAENIEISNILKKYDINPKIIGSIITGEYTENEVFTQLLHSSLDADRLDYLIRDLYHTGVRYGYVDIDYIINLMDVVNCNGKKTLVFDGKGRHVLEHFLMSRYFHYSQIIYHKTNGTFEGLMKILFIKLLKDENFIFNSYDEILNNINNNDFLKFNDHTLHYTLSENFKNHKDENFRLLYNNFTKRKRPKVIYEIKDLYEDRTSQEMVLIKNTLNKNKNSIEDILETRLWGYSNTKINISAIRNSYNISERDININNIEYKEELREAIRVKNRDGTISYLAEDDYSIINKLANYTSEFIRIYKFDYNDKTDNIDLYKKKISNI